MNLRVRVAFNFLGLTVQIWRTLLYEPETSSTIKATENSPVIDKHALHKRQLFLVLLTHHNEKQSIQKGGVYLALIQPELEVGSERKI